MNTPVNRPTSAPNADDNYATIANRLPAPALTEPASDYPFFRAPEKDDEIGRIGDYRVLRLLGSGGMGMVFLAEDIMLHRPVALKVMKPEADTTEQAGPRFLREARTMAAIKHDHLVTIYQVGQQDQTLFIAMELLVGESLESLLKSGACWEVQEILRVGQELAGGLAAIHERGLIHRDIKPANIWLEGEPGASAAPATAGRVKILDFGLVRRTKEDMALTDTGIIIGTPAFLSPEQARGKMADAASDLYSFGCVLYRLCTGRFPHEADNTLAQLAALVADDPTPVQQLNPTIPLELSDLVMQLLEKNPEDRPASAAVVAKRLQQIRRGLTDPDVLYATPRAARPIKSRKHAVDSGTEVLDADTLPQTSPWPKIAASVLSVLGLFALAILGGVLGFLWFTRPPEKKDAPQAALKKPGMEAGGKKAIPANATFLTDLVPVMDTRFKKKGKKGDDPFEKLIKKKDDKGFGDKDFDERVIVKGKLDEHGIFMHAAPPDKEPLPASLSFRLDKQYQTFAGTVGLNDSTKGSSSPVVFKIYGDDVPLWQSNEVQNPGDLQDFTVPVPAVRVLKLEVFTTEQDIGGAHGAWIEPYLVKKEK